MLNTHNNFILTILSISSVVAREDTTSSQPTLVPRPKTQPSQQNRVKYYSLKLINIDKVSTAKAKGSLAARVVSASFWTQAIRTNYRNPISAGSQTFKSRLHNKDIRWISFKYSKLFNSLDELGYWIKIKWIWALTSQNRLRWIRWPVVWKNKFHVFGQVFSHLSYNWLSIETI